MYMIDHAFEFFIVVNGCIFTIGIAALQIASFVRHIRDNWKNKD